MTFMEWKKTEDHIIGRRHEVSDNPVCQDAHKYLEKNGIYAIALADGAGSAQYSHHGAKKAVETICEYVCVPENFQNILDVLKNNDIEKQKEIKKQIKDLLLHAIKKECEKVAKETQNEVDYKQLAATLLFVAVQDNEYIIGHIGDGFIASLYENKTVKALSMPKNGSFANETFFITDKNMENNLEMKTGDVNTEKIRSFALMSDGMADGLWARKQKSFVKILSDIMEKVFYDNVAAEQNVKQLLELVKRKKTGDDCSIIIITNGGQFSDSLQEEIKLTGLEYIERTCKTEEKK